MPNHSWIEIEKIMMNISKKWQGNWLRAFFYLCLLFKCIDKSDFRKILMQSDFSTVNENNLNLSWIRIACQRGTFIFSSSVNFISEFMHWSTCNRNTCHATHLNLHDGCFFFCKEITLSAPCLKINLRSMKGILCF